MPKAKTAFFYAKDDGSDGYVNAGEEIPEGVDAGDNIRHEDAAPAPARRSTRK